MSWKLALASRLGVVAWCLVACLLPDHPAQGVRYFKDGAFTQWDAAWFLSIAQDGYTRPAEVAFFPGYPKLVRCLPFDVVVAAVLTSNLCFVIAAAALDDDVVPFFCLSPASVFFSSAYSESLFAALAFHGIALLRRGHSWRATFLFGLASLVRANGTLLALVLVPHALAKPHALSPLEVATKVCVVVAPAFIVDVAQSRFLEGGWPPSSAYSRVQKTYWDVGLLTYWQFKQIPNFVLAAPAIFLSASGCYRCATTSAVHLGLALHGAATILVVVLYAHVEIATRLLASSCLPFYWEVARRRPYVYLGLYILVGSACHVNWLPWT